MRFNLKYILMAVLFGLVLRQSLFAQPTVTHSFVNPGGLDAFFLKDLDINSPGNAPPIFFVNISRNNYNSNVVLRLTISSENDGELGSGQTGPFQLPTDQVRLSNNDLFTNSGPYRLVDFKVSEDILKALLANILATGRLPSDRYIFVVVILDENGSPFSGGSNTTDSFDIRISNPRKLDLVFPGVPASGNREDCQEVFTDLPQFRWESDLSRFLVIIAEAKPGEDPESALNQEPRFKRYFFVQTSQGALQTVPSFGDLGRVDVLPATSFQYPASGEILTLRPGEVYFWRVTGFIETSSGPIELESEIFCFRIARFDQISAGSDQYEFILRNFLGADYDKLFGENGQLQNYSPKRMVLNGQEVTVPDILTRLQKLNEKYSGYRVEN